MVEEKRFTRATWQIMEQLLEVDNLEDALSGSLEIIVKALNSEAGAIWFLDTKTDRLSPLFHMGPADISNITVENGLGIEGEGNAHDGQQGEQFQEVTALGGFICHHTDSVFEGTVTDTVDKGVPTDATGFCD